jgi:nucleotide-binding universal stress UspA family protein
MKVQSILVPVDFSPPSILAVNYGVALARKFRARLMLLHVSNGSQIPERDITCALSLLVSPEDQDDLNLLVLVKSGDIEAQIRAVSEENHADVLVMGTHGRRLLGRLLIGSITQDLMRKSTIPVLTVCHAVRPLEFRRILFATDGSDSARALFSTVLELAKALSASLTVVHVVAEPLMLYDRPGDMSLLMQARAAAVDHAKAHLTLLVALGKQENVTTESLLLDGDSSHQVLKAAADSDSDLIVIGVRRRGRFDRAVFGTCAEALIREARVPVLSLHMPTFYEEEHDTQIVGHWQKG